MRAALLLASAALITAPLASAQQYDGGGASAEIDVQVESAYDVGATAVAGGNSYAVESNGQDIVMNNGEQHADGAVTADANASIGSAGGNVVLTSAAVANGATANGYDADLDIRGAQLSHADVEATSFNDTGYVGNSATSASASANTAALAAQYGEAIVNFGQQSTEAVDAVTQASHWGSDGQVVADAISSANNMSAAGYTATMLTNTDQYSGGDHVNAEVQLYAGEAYDAVGNATANANSLTVDNQFGYANVDAWQESSADVNAQAYVTLGEDFSGFASAGAYGVGNSVSASNSASDMALLTDQNNSGDISADAGLIATGGEQALASSAAYGNVVTGALCGNCGLNGGEPELYASANQTNSGQVRARTTINAPVAGMVAGSATAIGNAASYSINGDGN